MAWTTPRTWVTAELVTAAIMNTHVRDDLAYLHGDASTIDLANSLSVKDYFRVTNSGGGQKFLIGNQDSSGANNPCIIGGSNGVLQFGSGDSWTTSGGTFTVWMSLTDAGLLAVNDTSNANMTVGLTLNQGAADDEILAFKSSDVAHGMTTVAETDTYGKVAKLDGPTGGLLIMGLGESTQGIRLELRHTTDTTTKAVTSVGALHVNGAKANGTSTQAMGANANLVAFANGDGATRHILDVDGDSHQDVGTAWTNFDDQADADLLTALSVHVSRPDDPIKTNFRKFLRGNRRRLEALELVQFNPDGHHFVNMSRLTMLLVGAVRQTNDRVSRLVAALGAAGLPPALLKGV